MRVSSNRRPRGGRTNSGGNRPGSGNNRRSGGGNRNYDSNGPDGKIRGTAQQVYDKYIAHGTDAQTSGDRVAAENYFQHAEHYFRIIAANTVAPKEKPTSESSDNAGNSGSAENAVNQGNSGNAENSAAPSENESSKPAQRKPRNRARDEATSGEEEKASSDTNNSGVDLSTAEQPIVDMSADGAAPALTPVADNEGEVAKPKRKVSRTRTLRRRTSSRNVDESDVEEANTTE